MAPTARSRCRTTGSCPDVLHEQLQLHGVREGCGTAVCGSCTVLLDGRPIASCLTLAARLDGRRIETIEGLSRGQQLHPIQEAFLEERAFQCGYCTPGYIMAVKGLLDENPVPQRGGAAGLPGGQLLPLRRLPRHPASGRQQSPEARPPAGRGLGLAAGRAARSHAMPRAAGIATAVHLPDSDPRAADRRSGRRLSACPATLGIRRGRPAAHAVGASARRTRARSGP